MVERLQKGGPGRILKDLLSGITQDYVRRNKQVPFHVMVPGIGEVECSHVYRVISSKRVVCRGRVGSRDVIVKLYFARWKAKRHWRRSERGCRAFIERGVPAPEILFSGYLPGHKLYAMVFEYLDNGRLDRTLEGISDPDRRNEILDALMATLAMHHEKGILQNDLHLGNFMIRDGTVYSLDGDQVTYGRKPIGRVRSLDNLAQLLTNLPATFDQGIHERIMAYGTSRGWDISDKEEKKIIREIYHIRRRNLFAYLKKALRDKDPFLASYENGFLSIYDKRHINVRLSDILDASRPLLEVKGCSRVTGYHLVDVGASKMSVLFSSGYGPLFLTRYWPACMIWKSALMLRWLRIEALTPVALVGMKSGRLRWVCLVFFMPVEGASLEDFFNSQSVTAMDKLCVARDIADACLVMNKMGISLHHISPDDICVSQGRAIFLKLGAIHRPLSIGRAGLPCSLPAFIQQLNDLPDMKAVLIEEFKKRKLV